jgi:hypothetical protein
MKKIFLSVASLLFIFTSQAFADSDFGVEIGIRQQSGDVSGGGSTSSQTGIQGGVVGAFEINGPLYFRTGMLYTQRPLTVDGAPDVRVSLNYVDIPIELMYKFQDYAGVFAGVVAALNLDHSADHGYTVTGTKSSILPFIFGATFKFAPQFGGTIYYETQSGDVADGLKDYRAVGANLLITFE